jgi:uncharacterized protein
MQLKRYDNVVEFYRRVEAFLLEREAEHNYLLGACTELMRYPGRLEQPPYLAALEEGGAVVAAAMMTSRALMISFIASGAQEEALSMLAHDLAGDHATLPGVRCAAQDARVFAELWHSLKGQAYQLWMAMRIYKLESVKPVVGVPGQLRRAVVADRDLVVEWIAAFNREALGETDTSRVGAYVDDVLGSDTRGVYLWVDGQPVSMAGYSGPTPNGIRVVAVYTPRERRGRGYASACVAALSQLLLDGGRKFCFLFTDLSNPTSNSIYQAIGYTPVSDLESYTFADP